MRSTWACNLPCSLNFGTHCISLDISSTTPPATCIITRYVPRGLMEYTYNKSLVLVYGLKPGVWGRVVPDPWAELQEQANSHSSDASYHGEQGYIKKFNPIPYRHSDHIFGNHCRCHLLDTNLRLKSLKASFKRKNETTWHWRESTCQHHDLWAGLNPLDLWPWPMQPLELTHDPWHWTLHVKMAKWDLKSHFDLVALTDDHSRSTLGSSM